mmetsp:Transcript_5946/g.13807  ORF Transcript_5946/g.13807 Transcript_5946/m.13807 type:complete len:255 (-) Transcript_5946:162-926(-)
MCVPRGREPAAPHRQHLHAPIASVCGRRNSQPQKHAPRCPPRRRNARAEHESKHNTSRQVHAARHRAAMRIIVPTHATVGMPERPLRSGRELTLTRPNARVHWPIPVDGWHAGGGKHDVGPHTRIQSPKHPGSHLPSGRPILVNNVHLIAELRATAPHDAEHRICGHATHHRPPLRAPTDHAWPANTNSRASAGRQRAQTPSPQAPCQPPRPPQCPGRRSARGQTTQTTRPPPNRAVKRSLRRAPPRQQPAAAW